MADDMALAGKVALVTGSSKGIGDAVARAFIAAGARVWAHGKEETAAIADAVDGRYCPADLGDPDQVSRLAETIISAEQRLDILVNNAGVAARTALTNIDLTQFDEVWAVNVRAAVQLTHLALPLLTNAGHASVVNMTSIHQSQPFPGSIGYSMAKAALAMFTKAAAVELAPFGIRVNNLAPGAIETDLTREALARLGTDEIRRRIPLGRVGQPTDMAGPALFLASDASRYITGTTVFADGGYSQNLLRYRSPWARQTRDGASAVYPNPASPEKPMP